MYETYWRVNFKPFENTPDPRFLYSSPKHEEGLMRLLYAARENKQGAILTGEYGSGKTMLSRALLQELHSDARFQTVLIVNPKLPKRELLREMLFQMGEQNAAAVQKEAASLRLLEARLRDNLARGKKTIFIVDEAQILKERELEELRLLLNFQNQEETLLTLILIGHGDLKRKVQNVEPLQQRIAYRFHLFSLNAQETESYVHHRLGVAGRKDPVFTPGALSLIYKGSRGIPRQINNICDYALLIGFSRKISNIGIQVIEDCLKDLDLALDEDKDNDSDSRHIKESTVSEGQRGEASFDDGCQPKVS